MRLRTSCATCNDSGHGEYFESDICFMIRKYDFNPRPPRRNYWEIFILIPQFLHYSVTIRGPIGSIFPFRIHLLPFVCWMVTGLVSVSHQDQLGRLTIRRFAFQLLFSLFQRIQDGKDNLLGPPNPHGRGREALPFDVSVVRFSRYCRRVSFDTISHI